MLIADDLILVGTDHGSDPVAQGHVYAFEAATGKAIWKYSAGTGISTDLLLDNSRLIAYGANGELFALDFRSGKPIWKKKITDPNPDQYLPSPVLIGDTIFAATSTGAVAAIRSSDGELLWRRQIETSGYLQLIAVNSVLHVVSSTKFLYGLNGKSGRITKTTQLPAAPSFAPSQTADSLVLQLADHTVRCIDKDGTLWTAKADGELTTHKSLIMQNQVIVADVTGKVAAWRLHDGVPEWSAVFSQLKAPITTLGADADMLYVGTQDGTLRAISFREFLHKD